jgi:Uma2 family endonuclease
VSATAETGKRLWTEAELQALPDDGYTHELVNGELVISPKNNFQREQICTRLLTALENYNQTHRLGAVLGSSFGCWMRNRNCRAPDISFIPKARLRALGFSPSTRKFLSGAPDLAVEILSPSNTRTEMDERLRDFFESGTQIAWIINPVDECLEVCHSLSSRELVGNGGLLSGEHLLPGFTYPLAELFKEWDWE